MVPLSVFILEDSVTRTERLDQALRKHRVTVCRSVAQATRMFKSEAQWDLVLLDHDLGGETWVDSDRPDCGMAFAKWLAEHDGVTPIVVHSLNPLGARKMVLVHPNARWVPMSEGLLDALGALSGPDDVTEHLGSADRSTELVDIDPRLADETTKAFLAQQFERATDREMMRVVSGMEFRGYLNTADDVLVEHIASAIRRGHPQVRPDPPKPDRLAIIGGGPTLEETLPELVDLVMGGVKIVALNHAYQWCLDHRLRPHAHVIMDAREANARFVGPPVPDCNYLYASQCHPSVWDAVDGRARVWIWHAMHHDNPEGRVLDAYYGGHDRWFGVTGGTTAATRAIPLMRMLGYFRFDLFGIDSCWIGDRHHAWDQPENEGEQRYRVTVTPEGHDDRARSFSCAPWHLKQMEDMLQMIRVNGDQFLLRIHGDGLLAHAIRASAKVQVEEAETAKEMAR